MKKIYFACSIKGGREMAHLYPEIVDIIKSTGATVLSELFADQTLTAEFGTTVKHDLSYEEIRALDLKMIKGADGLIAEVTTPSLGVGYEIAMAEGWKIPTLALYHIHGEKKISPMIAGSPNVKVITYSDVKETKSAIAKFLSKL